MKQTTNLHTYLSKAHLIDLFQVSQHHCYKFRIYSFFLSSAGMLQTLFPLDLRNSGSNVFFSFYMHDVNLSYLILQGKLNILRSVFKTKETDCLVGTRLVS